MPSARRSIGAWSTNAGPSGTETPARARASRSSARISFQRADVRAARGGWLYEFQTLVQQPFASSPEEEMRLQATFVFATVCATLWSASGIALNSFTLQANSEPPVAARTAAFTWLACGTTYLAGMALMTALLGQPMRLDVEVIEEAVGLGLSLALWRYYYAGFWMY